MVIKPELLEQTCSIEGNQNHSNLKSTTKIKEVLDAAFKASNELPYFPGTEIRANFVIDKLAIELEFPMNTEATMEAYQAEIKKFIRRGMAERLAPNMRYFKNRHVLFLNPEDKSVSVLVQIDPVKHGGAFMRLEFNPDKLGFHGMRCLVKFLWRVFPFELVELMRDVRIRKFHPAIDLMTSMNNLLIVRSYASSFEVFGKTVSKQKNLETLVFGARKSFAHTTAYDKVAAELDQYVIRIARETCQELIESLPVTASIMSDMMTPVRTKIKNGIELKVRGNFKPPNPATRIELRYEKINVGLHEIDNKIVKYFSSLQIYDFSAVENLKDDSLWRLVMLVSQSQGMAAAMHVLENKDKVRIGRIFNAHARNIWDGEYVYQTALDALKNLEIFNVKHLNPANPDYRLF